MYFKNGLAAILFSVVSTAISASPIEHASRSDLLVFVPHIFTPNEHTVWAIGTTQSVTWDTSKAPKVISNRAGVYLRRPNIMLARDFNLKAGVVNITVPKVTPGSYQITLFGDSGNWSKFFQIVAA